MRTYFMFRSTYNDLLYILKDNIYLSRKYLTVSELGVLPLLYQQVLLTRLFAQWDVGPVIVFIDIYAFLIVQFFCSINLCLLPKLHPFGSLTGYRYCRLFYIYVYSMFEPVAFSYTFCLVFIFMLLSIISSCIYFIYLHTYRIPCSLIIYTFVFVSIVLFVSAFDCLWDRFLHKICFV